jgi:tetratricopeptide (TPR) repeat protein
MDSRLKPWRRSCFPKRMSKDHFRARQLISQSRYAEALELLRKARAESPWSGLIAHDLALTLVRLDRGQEGTTVAEQMISEDPDDAFAHATLGLVQLKRGLADEGKESFARALALDPADATIHALFARAHLERDKPAEALGATETGLALDPDNELCLSFRAQALLALGRGDEAREISARLLQLDPDDSHNHSLRGYELIAGGRPAEAIPHFKEALRLDPGNDGARQGLATSLKARSPLFAALLRAFIALDRVNLWTMLAVLAGFLVGLNFLEKSLQADPVWLPVLASAKIVVYAGFLLSMIAHQLYEILLSFDSDGRQALSSSELRAIRWYPASITGALLCLWWGLASEKTRAPFMMAVGFIFMVKMISEVFESTPGYVRRRMTWLVVGTAALNILTPVFSVLLILWALHSGAAAAKLMIRTALMLGLVPILIASFSDNIRNWLERRRPDSD